MLTADPTNKTMKPQFVSRRTFLKTSSATAALATAGSFPFARNLFAAEDYGGNKIPIGLQLYTIGGDMRRMGNEAALAAVAKAGYKGVEFAGNLGVDAKALR